MYIWKVLKLINTEHNAKKYGIGVFQQLISFSRFYYSLFFLSIHSVSFAANQDTTTVRNGNEVHALETNYSVAVKIWYTNFICMKFNST